MSRTGDNRAPGLPSRLRRAYWQDEGAVARLVPFLLVLIIAAFLAVLIYDLSYRNVALFVVAPMATLALLGAPILGLHVTVLLSPVFSPKMNIGFVNLSLHQMIILISSFLLAVMLFLRRRGQLRSSMNGPLVLLLLSVLLSYANAPSLVGAVRWTLYLGILFSSYFLCLAVVTSTAHLRLFVKLMVASSVLLVLSTLLIGKRSDLDLEYEAVSRISGGLVLDNPNSLGNYLALIIPFFLALFVHLRPAGARRVFSLAGILVLAGILLATFSRGSWLGAALGCLGLQLFFKPRLAVASAAVLAVVIIFLSGPIQQRILHMDYSAKYRLTKIGLAWEKFKDHKVIGCGPGSFEDFCRKSGIEYLRMHTTLENQYALTLVEQGSLGVLALLVMSAVFLTSCRQAYLTLKSPLSRAMLLGCLGSYLAMLGISVGEAALYYPKYNWFIGFVLALPAVLLRIEAEEADHREELHSGHEMIAMGGAGR